jgi:hypothetical protein
LWAEWRWDAFLSEYIRFSCRYHSTRAPLSYQKDKRSKCWDLQQCTSGNRVALGRKLLDAYRLVHTVRCCYTSICFRTSPTVACVWWSVPDYGKTSSKGPIRHSVLGMTRRIWKCTCSCYQGSPKTSRETSKCTYIVRPVLLFSMLNASVCCFQCTVDILLFYIAWLHGHFLICMTK